MRQTTQRWVSWLKIKLGAETSLANFGDFIEKFFRRALKLLLEWYEIHKDALGENWELCQNKEMPKQIEPLE